MAELSLFLLFIKLWFAFVPVCLQGAMLVGSETLTKTNLKRKWFVSLVLPRNRPPLRNVRAGTQAGAEAGAVEKIYLLSGSLQ